LENERFLWNKYHFYYLGKYESRKITRP
jgi:hypothetical protein